MTKKSTLERVRYRPFTVLASACTQPEAIDLSPSGRFLIIEKDIPQKRIQRIDLVTGQTDVLPLEAGGISGIYQLDDHRLFIRFTYGAGYALLDLNNNTRIDLPSVAIIDLEADVLRTLRQAEEIWVLQIETLALAPDYHQHPDQNIVVYAFDQVMQERINQQLEAAGIAYRQRPRPYTTGPVADAAFAQNGRFWADAQGIALAGTRERLISVRLPTIAQPDQFHLLGWTPDNRAVVYAAGTPYLFEEHGMLFNAQYFPIPQPILLVEVPEEYRE